MKRLVVMISLILFFSKLVLAYELKLLSDYLRLQEVMVDPIKKDIDQHINDLNKSLYVYNP
jgi:hypothetical protein